MGILIERRRWRGLFAQVFRPIKSARGLLAAASLVSVKVWTRVHDLPAKVQATGRIYGGGGRPEWVAILGQNASPWGGANGKDI